MTQQISIPARFNGPPTSANGGYSCGALASYIEGPAKVRLSSPPPLDQPLSVVRTPHNVVELRQGDALVATASQAPLNLDIPGAPSLEVAREASRRYAGHESHALPTCFVCGPQRHRCDGMRLFAGPVANSMLSACVWAPTGDQLDGAGHVQPEIVWAALDCPGYFAVFRDEQKPALLGELTAELLDVVPGGEEYVVYGWAISSTGRKHLAGTAVADASGRILACAEATWIELKA